MEHQINRNSSLKYLERALYSIKELSILIIELYKSNSNRELSHSIKEQRAL